MAPLAARIAKPGDEEVSLLLQNSGRRRPPRSTSRRDAEAEEEQRGGECHHREQHESANVGLRVGEGEWSHLAHGGPWRPASGGAPDLCPLAANAHCRALGCSAGLQRRPLCRSSRSARCSDDDRGRRLRRRRLCRWRLGRYTRLRGRLGAWLWLRFGVWPEPCCRGRSAREATGERQGDQELSGKSARRPQVRHRLHLLTDTY
jgi:hypothetical protein